MNHELTPDSRYWGRRLHEWYMSRFGLLRDDDVLAEAETLANH